MEKSTIYSQPRKYNTIELWKEVNDEQWNNPDWQLKNSIRSVEQLKKVIKLNRYQEKEIERTIRILRNQISQVLIVLIRSSIA